MASALKGPAREALLEELHQRYNTSVSLKQRFIYVRKKYSWLLIIEGTRVIKRTIDLVTSLILLACLFPLMVAIACIIKCYDGGPVFYVTDRVGRRGKEFRFPKFRSMIVDAEKHKDSLLQQNIHQKDAHFKMRQDPRITTIGKILRKTSLDELPQLWCVVKGDMSLVGPRPPLVSEVAKYTIDQRKRLEVKPGLTCIWQVSGRSEIPFQQQVRLDLQYIESQSFWLDIKLLLKTVPAVILGKGAY